MLVCIFFFLPQALILDAVAVLTELKAALNGKSDNKAESKTSPPSQKGS